MLLIYKLFTHFHIARESKIYISFTIEACYNYVDRAKDFVEKNINGHE